MFDHVWVIFNLNIIKRLAKKPRRINLPYFGLVTFRFHFGKTRQPLIFKFFGPSGRYHDSQNQYYLSLDTPEQST